MEQRHESVIAVVCHGFFIHALFGPDIHKTFDVLHEDQAEVQITSVPNCVAHEVIIAKCGTDTNYNNIELTDCADVGDDIDDLSYFI